MAGMGEVGMGLIALQADILTKGKFGVSEKINLNSTILLVDDEKSVRDFLQMLLEGEGYQVLTAGNGEVALDVYSNYQSDIALVISDIKMPKMDGVALYRSLSEHNPKVKFIAVSGCLIPETINQLTTWGLIDVMRKPFSIETLLQKVEAMLQ